MCHVTDFQHPDAYKADTVFFKKVIGKSKTF